MYDILARFYDAVHADVREDIDFILEAAKVQRGDVLDLGCGTGRITIPLAQAGFQVVGLDNEQQMLELAAEKARVAGVSDHVAFIKGDMVSFSLERDDFALIVITYNTAMHLNQLELRTALRTARRHLRVDGLLLIDFANPIQLASAPDQPQFALEQRMQTHTNGEVLQYARWKNDVEKQQVTVEWRYVPEDGQITNAKTVYHYIYPHALQMMMEKSGLEWQAVYGNYDRSAFKESSERMIVFAGCC